MGYKYRNITTATTTTVKSGRGALVAIVNNKTVASGVVTVYDNTSATGNKIATITNPATLLASQYKQDYVRIDFTAGLTIVTSQAEDLTIIYE